MNRRICPNCGEETAFVQFGGSESSVTETTVAEVGDGILELRICDNCAISIENVLNAEQQKVIEHNA